MKTTLIIFLLLLYAVSFAERKFTSACDLSRRRNVQYNQSADGFTLNSFLGYDQQESYKRSGVTGNRWNGNQGSGITSGALSVVQGLNCTGKTCFRAWISTGTVSPSTTSAIMLIAANSVNIDVDWKTDGKMQFTVGGSVKFTTSASQTNKTMFLLKMSSKWLSVGNVNTVTIDNESFSDTTPVTTTTTAMALWFGWWSKQTSTATWFTMDDIAFNDAGGNYENGEPEDSSHVFYVPPVSDNAINDWTLQAGGTSSLYFPLGRDIPPGRDVETDTTGIMNTVSSATSNYDANLMTYVNAGIVDARTIRVIIPFVRHGEHSATGTAAGSIQLMSNPAQTGETSFNFGNDLGAHYIDAYTGGSSTPAIEWWTTFGAPLYPQDIINSVDVYSSAVLRIGKRTASTKQVCVDKCGLLVECGNMGGWIRSHH
jgi:hypothetical protein